MCPRPVAYSKVPFSKRHLVLDPSELLELECAADLLKHETEKGPNMNRALIKKCDEFVRSLAFCETSKLVSPRIERAVHNVADAIRRADGEARFRKSFGWTVTP